MHHLNLFLFLTLITTSLTLSCPQGSLPSPSGTCITPIYIQGCLTYASPTSCQLCQYNYVQNNNICTYSPPSDYSGCCITFNAVSGLCTQCANGLSLVNGKCLDIKSIGCLLKDPTGTCLNCASQYTLFGGQCIKNIQGCVQYMATSSCAACDPKYSLVNGYCVPNSVLADQNCSPPWSIVQGGNCSIPGCRSYFDYGCAVCQDGFRLLPDGSCLLGVIQGCDKYAVNGSCYLCLKPFYTQSSGYCMGDGCLKLDNNGRCSLCDSSKGYGLAGDGSCIITNCQVSSGGQCLICSQGYVETPTGCLLQQPVRYCTTCGQGYFLSDSGECAPKQEGCLSYSGSKCSSCDSQYYLSTNYQCVLKQPGCIYNNGLCSSCSPPFKINSTNGKCMIEGCNQYSTSGCLSCVPPYILDSSGRCTYSNCLSVLGGICQYCADGYAVSKDGFCFLMVPNCKTYSPDYLCIECNIGYYLDTTTATSPSCTSGKFGCNYVDGLCVSCRAPFTYNPNMQSCEIDGCLTYFLGGCQQCSAGYSLQYNACKLPNCLISFQGHCSQCNPDYVMTDSGVCVNKDEFCWTYDSNGVCIECAPNYYMSKLQNKCLPRETGCLYDENDRCYACDLPFYFDGVRCEIYGCMKLSNTGCSICMYPMQVIPSTGLCSVVNCDRMDKALCVVCKPGFVLSPDGSCQTQDPNCLVSSVTGCTTCIKGYVIDMNGRCQYVDQHCANFSAQGNCTNCDRLYFLNIFNKCEIKDSNCIAYSGGRCIQCKTYYYIYGGLCLPNSQGCLSQVNPKTCSQCQANYVMASGICTPTITKLDWNSIVMNFSTPNTSQQVFTVGKTNKYNLDGAILKGQAQIIFSTCVAGRTAFQVDDNSQPDGWSPTSLTNAYIGVLLQQVQIYYALDIKYLQGCTMTQFAIYRSDDGINFIKVSDQTVTQGLVGTVQTFYFTPVQALAMRIVVLLGMPNIKFQFYYSNGQNIYASDNSTYIQQQITSTVLDALHGQLFSTNTSCVDKELCWMGIELCDVTAIQGFTLVPNGDSNGTITTVTVKYSLDGVQFGCYNGCNQLVLSGDGKYVIQPPVMATKLRVYPGKYTGSPSYSITFQY